MEKNSYEILRDIRVLYVEDETDIAEPISGYLGRRCQEVILAKNGEDGLEKYREQQPDVIVTDINMPKMDGMEMARRIKEENPEMPIIITTAHSDENLFLSSIEIGIDHYLIKPIMADKLIEALTRVAQQLQLEAEIQKKNTLIQQLLDFQDSLLLLSNGYNVKFCNQRFLEFFGFETLEQFREQYECVCDFFIREDGFIYKDEHSNWLEYLIAHPERQHKVKMKDERDRIDRTFIIRAALPGEGDDYIISLTDITQLEQQRIQLEDIAMKDDLTGIYNRRKFNTILEFELKKLKRLDEQFSLIMFDIDHFKKVNDTYGHLVGDDVLVNLIKLVAKRIREVDVVSRWGGEEFLILALGTSLEHARRLAEDLRAQIESQEIADGVSITCSFGVTEAKEDDTIKSLIQRSDEAMYHAKANGRNRVEIAV